VSPLLVKICGVTRLADALAAVDAGADALGFNFWAGSPRYIHPEAAREIVERLPPSVEAVGVFVGASEAEIAEAARVSGVAAAQLHGDEGPALVAALALPAIKALRVTGPEVPASAADFHAARALLLDGPGPGRGGGGVPFRWSLAAALCARRPVLIAGGLGPDNVADAVRQARPLGVDVASGVERSPGVKDTRAVARFVAAAKEAHRAG
jgi:phosphoribosylanthranilate isomerase